MASFDVYIAALNVPWVLVTIPFILLAMVILLRFYIKSFREINRLGSTTRSPLMNHLGETINGTTTIRSFGNQQAAIKYNYEHLNVVTNVGFWRESLRSWFAIRIEFVSLFLLGFTSGFLVSFLSITNTAILQKHSRPSSSRCALQQILNVQPNVVIWMSTSI